MKKKLLAAALCLTMALGISMSAVYAGETETAEASAPAESELTDLQVGDTVKDFSVTLSDGTEFTLSEALKDHKAVFLNVWATYCPPCRAEFPALNAAANRYSDDIYVLALSFSPLDDNSAVSAFKEALNLDFNMAGFNSAAIENLLPISGLPTSYMISQDGVLCWKKAAEIPDENIFELLFKTFADSDSPASLVGFELPDSSPEMFGIQPVSDEELTAAIDADPSVITCRNDDSEQSFPFHPVQGGGLTATGAGHTSSESKLLLDVKASAGDVLRLSVVENTLALSQFLTIISEDGAQKSYLLDEPHKEIDYVFPSDSEDGIQHICVVFSIRSDSEVDKDQFFTITRAQVLSGEEAAAVAAKKTQYPAVLEGSDMTVEIPEDMEPVHFFEDNQDVTYSFGLPVHYMSPEPVRVHISVGPDIDPETTVLLENKSETFVRLSDCETDETGFYTEIDPAALQKADSPFINIMTFDPINVNYSDSAIRISSDAESLDAYCNDISNLNPGVKMSWGTAEGPVGPGNVTASEETKAEETEATQTEAKETEASYEGYAFRITDQHGDPVENVMLLVCDDSTCSPYPSDADGMIQFDRPEANFVIHILSAPDGYTFDADKVIETPVKGVLTPVYVEKQ